jgi:hypothetical protein
VVLITLRYLGVDWNRDGIRVSGDDDYALLGLLFNGNRRGRRQQVSRVLHIRHHQRRGVQVELLHCVVGTEREQGRAGPIDGETSDMFQRWYAVIGDVLCSNIPRQSFAVASDVSYQVAKRARSYAAWWAYLSEYWIMRPFFDQPIQLGPFW